MWGGARAAGAEQALRTGPAYHVGVLRSTPPPQPQGEGFRAWNAAEPGPQKVGAGAGAGAGWGEGPSRQWLDVP